MRNTLDNYFENNLGFMQKETVHIHVFIQPKLPPTLRIDQTFNAYSLNGENDIFIKRSDFVQEVLKKLKTNDDESRISIIHAGKNICDQYFISVNALKKVTLFSLVISPSAS